MLKIVNFLVFFLLFSSYVLLRWVHGPFFKSVPTTCQLTHFFYGLSLPLFVAVYLISSSDKIQAASSSFWSHLENRLREPCWIHFLPCGRAVLIVFFLFIRGFIPRSYLMPLLLTLSL